MNLNAKTKIILSSIVVAACTAAFAVFVNFSHAAATPNNSAEIDQLNASITDKKKQLQALQAQQDAYQKALAEKQAQHASLQNQIAIVNNNLSSAQLKLDQSKIDIETTNLEIQKVGLEIDQNNQAITQNKSQLASAIRLLSQEGDRSQLEILLMNNYLTEYMNQVQYLQDINTKITQGLTNLKQAKLGLDQSKASLEANKEKLASLRQDLQQSQVQLASEKDSKSFLLDETRSSEAQYQKLLAQAKQQQDAANSDIVNMEKVLRQKLSATQGNGQPALSYNGFIWPIASRRITAYFHDPSYPFRYIFEHPAIDIATPQGTPLKAAASGYVGTAHNGGMNYSYIMIVHGSGLATVYGHVSKIYVQANEYVAQGQIIGLSGATPGTPGAGPFTTGPHLHLEVRLNGIPVNPLDYLP